MFRVTFNFYAPSNVGSWIIAARLGSKLTHCSVTFQDKTTIKTYHSTLFGGCQILETGSISRPVEAIAFDVTEEQYKLMQYKAYKLLGQRYDIKAIFGFMFVTRFEDETGLFCSEFCNQIFKAAFPNEITRRTLITPSELRSYLEGFKLGQISNIR